jgi:hypothetical protein
MPKLVFLSDLHLGIDAPTNWYQSLVHQPMLQAIFDHLGQETGSIEELIILGDLVDQWTYLPSVQPPDFRAIAAAQPAILGPAGALARAARALPGRVTYLLGNHDLLVDPSEVEAIFGAGVRVIADGKAPVYCPPAGGARADIICTHGHRYSMFNAPDFQDVPALGLPLGHYVTRLSALWVSQHLQAGQTSANLAGSGNPSGWVLDRDILENVVTGVVSGRDDLSQLVFSTLLQATGQTLDLDFRCPDGTTTKANILANSTYRGLYRDWEDTGRFPVSDYGLLPGSFALVGDLTDNLGHFADVLGKGRKVVVMGHTHAPQLAINHYDLVMPYLYANAGFECPSLPDFNNSGKRQYPTFVEVELDGAGNTYEVAVRFVERVAGSSAGAPAYRVADSSLLPIQSIRKSD